MWYRVMYKSERRLYPEKAYISEKLENFSVVTAN